MKRLILPMVFAVLLLNAATLWADATWHNEMDVTLGSDDNIGLSDGYPHKQSDNSIALELGRYLFVPTGPQTAVRVGAIAGGQRHQDATGLDHHSVGLSTAFLWQRDAGFRSPRVRASLALQGDRFRASQRDRLRIRAGLQVSRRFTDRITLAAGGEFIRHEGSSTFLDANRGRGFVHLDYALPGWFSVYLSGSYLRGTFIGTQQSVSCDGDQLFPDNNDPSGFPSPWIDDQVFNQAFCGDWISYRWQGNAVVSRFGVNVPLNNTMSIDISMEQTQASGDSYGDYDRGRYQGSFLWRF